jgi:hypothetical protein
MSLFYHLRVGVVMSDIFNVPSQTRNTDSHDDVLMHRLTQRFSLHSVTFSAVASYCCVTNKKNLLLDGHTYIRFSEKRKKIKLTNYFVIL